MWSGNEVINKIIVNILSAFITLAVGAIAWFSKDTVVELRNVQIQQAGMNIKLTETNKNLEKTNLTLEKQETRIESVIGKQDRQHHQIIEMQNQLKGYQEERKLYWKRINGE